MTTHTYQIPIGNLSELASEIERINRRAARMGLRPVVLTEGQPVDVPHVRYDDGVGGYQWLRECYRDGDLAELERQGRVRYRRLVPVTIEAEAPTAAGWQFAATLTYVEAEGGERMTLLRTVPDLDGDLPAEFRTSTPDRCDHCGARRRRNETFVVRRVADADLPYACELAVRGDVRVGDRDGARMAATRPAGTWLQVGRNCLADFLPGADPHRIAAALEMLLQATSAASSAESDGIGEGGWWSGDRTGLGSLREFLGVVAALVRHDGWVSRTRARETDDAYYTGARLTATADSAIEYLDAPPRDSRAREEWQRWRAARPVEQEDRDLADRALEYARADLAEKVAPSDYEHNLRVACAAAAVDRRLVGVAASLIPYYLREVERRVLREAEAARVRDSRHLGAVGDRLLLRVQVARIITVGEESQWGPSYLHKLVGAEGDAAGCALVWFSSNPEANLRPGQVVWVRGTVKKHDERDGVQQTVLARIAQVSDEDAARELERARKRAEREAKKAARAAEVAA